MRSLMQREWPRSMNGALRIVIIVVAGFSIWQFSDGFLLAWETLAEPTEARWFNVLSALGEGLLGPLLAVVAIRRRTSACFSRQFWRSWQRSCTSRHSPHFSSQS